MGLFKSEECKDARYALDAFVKNWQNGKPGRIVAIRVLSLRQLNGIARYLEGKSPSVLQGYRQLYDIFVTGRYSIKGHTYCITSLGSAMHEASCVTGGYKIYNVTEKGLAELLHCSVEELSNDN